MMWRWRYVGAKWEFYPLTSYGPTVVDKFSINTSISGKSIGNRDAQYLVNLYSSDGKRLATTSATEIGGSTSFCITTGEELYDQLVPHAEMGAIQGWLEVLTTEEMTFECHVEQSYIWKAPYFAIEGMPSEQTMSFWKTYPVPLVLDTLRGFRAFVWLRSRAPFRSGRQ
jgi:hypothetical protein